MIRSARRSFSYPVRVVALFALLACALPAPWALAQTGEDPSGQPLPFPEPYPEAGSEEEGAPDGAELGEADSAAGEDDPEEAEPAAAEDAGPKGAAEPVPGLWAPPLPDAKAFDWIQMRSGEWLKGNFERLRDQRVYFDSDEFDKLNLNWKKVTAFYLPTPHSFRVSGRVVFGTAELRGRVLRIRTAEEILEFDRSDVDSIAQGSGSELDWWSFTLNASMSARRGNTDQVDLSGLARLRRDTPVSRFINQYRGVFSEVDNSKTASNHRVNSDFDYFLTERVYWTIPAFEYFADEIQKIDARISPGTTLGYEFVRNSWLEVTASVGAAYQFTALDSDVRESRTSHDFAILHHTRIDLDLPGGTEWDNLYRLQLVATDLGKTNHHAESTFSFDAWGPIDLDVTFIWDRIESPVNVDQNRDEPKRDDFYMLVGLTLDF